MSTTSLTAKYRPQTFAEVAGQDAVKAILSRAAAEDKVAPAYLFSGTRGVGKTTIARIFAKALNCKQAPTAEPCNVCVSCKQAAAGVAVDVIEIDAASHGKVDDARRLKEDIGYAPLEGRYKVFIIDEAHMLTTQAFNALLKTLEEPPPRVTFIMATTEVHKFPATILSRCQQYTFKMLPQAELTAHLESILNRENVPFEPGALSIIARRGAGSVRDSMSLLGQALAFSGETLREDEVRSFLGLAGQDVFFSLMEAIHGRDLVKVGTVLRQVLDRGLDLGFFLRELTTCWRNMFLLRQAGQAALPLLDLSGEEAEAWQRWAAKFAPAHIHACWQLTIEGQRRVLTSLEPAMALELLLLNLAYLPDLIPVGEVDGTQAPSGSVAQGANGGQQGPPNTSGGPPPHSRPGPGGGVPQAGPHSNFRPQAAAASHPENSSPASVDAAPSGGVPAASGKGRPHSDPSVSDGAPGGPSAGNVVSGPNAAARPHAGPDMSEPPMMEEPPPADESSYSYDDGPEAYASTPPWEDYPEPLQTAPQGRTAPGGGTSSASQDFSTPAPSRGATVQDAASPPAVPTAPTGPKTWQGFLAYVETQNGEDEVRVPGLARAVGNFENGVLTLTCLSQMHCDQLQDRDTHPELLRLVRTYYGPETDVRIFLPEQRKMRTQEELRKEVEAHPGVKRIMEGFQARMLSVEPRRKD